MNNNRIAMIDKQLNLKALKTGDNTILEESATDEESPSRKDSVCMSGKRKSGIFFWFSTVRCNQIE